MTSPTLFPHVRPLRVQNTPMSALLGKALVVKVICALAILGGCGAKPVDEAVVPLAPPQATQDVAAIESLAAPAPQAEPEKKTQRAASPIPRVNQEDAAGGKAISIAGGWVNAGGACDSGASVFFNADGTYMSEGEKGTWALTGKTLTVTTATTFEEVASIVQGPDESSGDAADRSEKTILTLLSVTDDAASVVLSNGSNANWTRCTS